MSGVLKVIGTIAGAIALVATGVGAFAVAGSALAATAGSIATYAGLAAGVANIGSAALAKPPPARGSVTSVIIAPEAPMPYVMGEGYYAGVLRYQRSYGATLKKVPNPYRFMVCVYSGGGPIHSITPYVDQGAVSSWYSGFLYTGTKLGACPDTALTPQFSGAPGWTTSSKLSGKACIGWSLKFDKDGKRFASGVPQLGAYGKWVKVYDPRKDSTFPGGTGAHRLGVESTYEWSENPALHAGTYAFGRYQGGVRVFGIGLPAEAIDWDNIAAWANTCQTNGWALFGPIFEPGDRWANLKDISAAGGAVPIPGVGPLTFHFQTPRISLDTITADDLLASERRSVVAMASWAARLNTLVPKYRSPAHNWELVQADPVVVSSYLSEDGETKAAEWPFNLVKSVNQAAQLARYKLEDSREMQPIVLPCTLRLAAYRPGDQLDLDLVDELGLEGPAVIVSRHIDPEKLMVNLTMMTEATGKHAYALGQTTAAPPTPALTMTAQERDELISTAGGYGRGCYRLVQQSVSFPFTSSATSISIAAFTGVTDVGDVLSFPADTITGLENLTSYAVLWNLDSGGYEAVPQASAESALASSAYVFLGWQATSSISGSYPAYETAPGGWGGTGGRYEATSLA